MPATRAGAVAQVFHRSWSPLFAPVLRMCRCRSRATRLAAGSRCSLVASFDGRRGGRHRRSGCPSGERRAAVPYSCCPRRSNGAARGRRSAWSCSGCSCGSPTSVWCSRRDPPGCSLVPQPGCVNPDGCSTRWWAQHGGHRRRGFRRSRGRLVGPRRQRALRAIGRGPTRRRRVGAVVPRTTSVSVRHPRVMVTR